MRILTRPLTVENMCVALETIYTIDNLCAAINEKFAFTLLFSENDGEPTASGTSVDMTAISPQPQDLYGRVELLARSGRFRDCLAIEADLRAVTDPQSLERIFSSRRIRDHLNVLCAEAAEG